MRQNVLRMVLLVAGLLASASGAWAQTRSSITGTVKDSSGGVLPGVAVSLESPQLVGGAQHVITNERGEYRFIDLPPGTYELTAALSGMQTARRTGLALQFGTTATIDLALGVGGGTEVVVVEGRAPAVDVTTAEATNKIEASLLEDTPVTPNQAGGGAELIQLSPGIVAHSSFGGARDANELLLDGSPTTIPERQGTNAAVVNSNWLQEIQVVSLGASAEYGDFTGTVANFVVRSGSNDFNGMLEYKTIRPSWTSDNTGSLPPNIQSRFNSLEILTNWDATGQVGGPILKDKLFFFAGFEYSKNRSQNPGAPAVGETTAPRAIGKVTWAASNTVRVEGTINDSNSDTKSGGAAGNTLDTLTRTTLPNTLWTARATWTARPSTLVEFRTGGLHYQQNIEPNVGTREGPPPHRDVVTGISSSNAATYREQVGKRLNFGTSVTRYVQGGLGRGHQVKVGADFETFSFLTDTGFPGGLSFQDRNGAADIVVIWPGDVKEGTGTHTSLYAQDSWKVTDRITLEPGVRVALNRGSTSTTGEVYSTTPVSPRIGGAWDATSDHRTVVRAHWGRFHEAFGTVLYDFTDVDGLQPQVTARVLGPGRYQEINRTNPSGNAVDPNVEQAFMDQFLIGVEREVLHDFGVKLQYIHRDYKDMFGYVDTRSIYAPVQVKDPGPDGVLGNADDGGPLTAFNVTNPGQSNLVLTNPDGAYRRYRAFQVVAQKRFSHNWQMLASYTRSTSKGNVNNDITDNYGGVPASNPFVNPNNAINAEGRNTHDYPNEFSFRGSYRIDAFGGLSVGAAWRYFSGNPWSRTATFRLTQGNQVIRVAPRGTEPSEAFNQIDFRLDKTVNLGSRSRRLGIYVDVFNATNQGIADRARFTENSGGTFGIPLGWVAPRTVQAALRLMF
jgi:hypothetical protein